MKAAWRCALAFAWLASACTEDDDGEQAEGTTAGVDDGSSSESSATPTGSATSVATSSASTTTSDPSTTASETSGDTDVPEGPEPTIPEPQGECPDLVSGTQDIGGLSTMIVAGTPGPTKGPLILYWHGTGSSPDFEVPAAIPTSVGDEILAEGGIIVAPQSDGSDRGGFTPNGVWYEGTDGEGGDLTWADQIVACAVANHNIDPRRSYTTGCSAGGLMAGGLATKRSGYIASATPNSGGIIVSELEDPARVPAVMTMHGGTDDTVLVNFGQTSAALDNLIVGAGGFAVDCNHMMGHCLAPEDLRLAAWEFMKAHPFGRAPSPFAGGLPDGFPSYCTIW